MKGQVVNLNRERWLGLANLALAAAADPAEAEALGLAAAKMATATPPAAERYAMAICLSFRWACQAYAFAGPAARPGLAGALGGLAEVIRRLFDHHPAPREAASMPVPTPAPDLFDAAAPEHAWQKRADLAS